MATRFITKGSAGSELDGFARRFVFRPSRNAEELGDLLRIRTAAFRNVHGGRIVAPSARVDVDAYDRFAHQLGLFAIEPSGAERAIGYTRLITEATSPQTNQLFQIVKADRELCLRISSKRPAPFPSICYFPELGDFYEMASRSGERIAEPSRFSLQPTIHSPRLARFIAFGAIAYAFSAGFNNGVMSSRQSHMGLYRLLGFSPCNDDPPRYVYSIGWEVMPLIRWHSELDVSVRDQIKEFTNQFRAAGRVCLEPRQSRAGAQIIQKNLPITLENCA